MAKWYAAEVGVKVVDSALQLHGGYGYIDEYDISRFYRDAKIVEIYEGVKEVGKTCYRAPPGQKDRSLFEEE